MFRTINQTVLIFVNGHAGQNALLDAFVLELSGNHLFKGVIVAMVLVGLWASQADRSEDRRTGVISTMLISMVAIFNAHPHALRRARSCFPLSRHRISNSVLYITSSCDHVRFTRADS